MSIVHDLTQDLDEALEALHLLVNVTVVLKGLLVLPGWEKREEGKQHLPSALSLPISHFQMDSPIIWKYCQNILYNYI